MGSFLPWHAAYLSVVVLTSCNSNGVGFSQAASPGDLSFGPAPRQAYDEIVHAQCGTEDLTDMGAAGFVRRPYVQSITDTSAQIVWTSNVATEYAVHVRPAGTNIAEIHSAVKTDSAYSQTPQYHASIQDLTPATVYCFEVLANGVQWLGPTGFVTAPTIGSPKPVRMIAIGDLGDPTSDQRNVLRQVKSVAHDFIAIAGDVAYNDGTLQQFNDNFFKPYQDVLMHIPAFPAIGNHDNRTDNAGPYREVFRLPDNQTGSGQERWYSLDWGMVHVVVLDSETADPAQMTWLEQDLLATAQPWKVAVLHKPPYSSGHHGSAIDMRQTYAPIFESHGIQIVFAGHDHHYERIIPQGGVTYIVTGGGGRGTRAVGTSDFTAYAARVAHFVYGVFDTEAATFYAIDATGETFDTFQIVR